MTDLPYFTSAEFLSERATDANRMFVATMGVPSRLKDLVVRAALAAYRRKSSKIAMEDFATVFEHIHRARSLFSEVKKKRETRRTLAETLNGQVINPFTTSGDLIDTLANKMAA